MSRYIDADMLIDKIERMWDTHQLTNTKHKTFVDLLNAEPTADVRPNVRGEWECDFYYEPGDDDEIEICQCSVCKKAGGDWRYNFCPNCGADMREKEQEDRT